jgi:hypothetical protein
VHSDMASVPAVAPRASSTTTAKPLIEVVRGVSKQDSDAHFLSTLD